MLYYSGMTRRIGGKKPFIIVHPEFESGRRSKIFLFPEVLANEVVLQWSRVGLKRAYDVGAQPGGPSVRLLGFEEVVTIFSTVPGLICSVFFLTEALR